MKKILIIFLIVLLITFTYLLIFKEVHVFNWKNNNIDSIKSSSNELEDKIKNANQIKELDYKNKKDELENSIRKMKLAKNKYESKMKSYEQDIGLGIIEIKQYKIERLWITLAGYAENRNVDLVLDLKESNKNKIDNYAAKLYDLNITLEGDYINITDFIYDIENDDTLHFKISEFQLIPPKTNSQTSTDTVNTEIYETDSGIQANKVENVENEFSVVGNNLKATFKIEGIGIELN